MNRCGMVRADRLLTSFCVSSVVEAQYPQLVSSNGIRKKRTPNLRGRGIAKEERSRGSNLRRSFAMVADLNVAASFARSLILTHLRKTSRSTCATACQGRSDVESARAFWQDPAERKLKRLQHSLQLPCLFSSKILVPVRESVREIIFHHAELLISWAIWAIIAARFDCYALFLGRRSSSVSVLKPPTELIRSLNRWCSSFVLLQKVGSYHGSPIDISRS